MPEWLAGSLVRDGPALFDAGGESVDHWSDGLATLRRFAVRDGVVEYGNRFLRTDAHRDALAGTLPAGFSTGGSTYSASGRCSGPAGTRRWTASSGHRSGARASSSSTAGPATWSPSPGPGRSSWTS